MLNKKQFFDLTKNFEDTIHNGKGVEVTPLNIEETVQSYLIQGHTRGTNYFIQVERTIIPIPDFDAEEGMWKTGYSITDVTGQYIEKYEELPIGVTTNDIKNKFRLFNK